MDARSKAGRGGLERAQFVRDLARQFVQVLGLAVGERAFGLLPHPFVGIQFRRVAGQELDMQSRMAFQERLDLRAFVDLSVVPQQHHRAGHVAQEMP